MERLIIQNEILKIMNKMEDDELVKFYNKYCIKRNKQYKMIYNIEDFDDVMKNETPTSIANRVYFGKFSPRDDYFMFAPDNSLISFICPAENIRMYDIVDYIIDRVDDLGNEKINQLLIKYYLGNK